MENEQENPVIRWYRSVAFFIIDVLVITSSIALIFSGVAMFASIVTGDYTTFGGDGFQKFLGIAQGVGVDGAMAGMIVRGIGATSNGEGRKGFFLLLVGVLLACGVALIAAMWNYQDISHLSTEESLAHFGINSVAWCAIRGVTFATVAFVTYALLKQHKHVLTEEEVAELEKQRELESRVARANVKKSANNLAARFTATRSAIDAARKGKSTVELESSEAEQVTIEQEPAAPAEPEVAPAPGPTAAPRKRTRTPRPAAATPVIASNAINRSHNSSPYSDNSESLPYGSPAGNGGLLPPVGTESLYEHTLSPQEERSAEISAAATGAPAGRLHLSVPTGGYRS